MNIPHIRDKYYITYGTFYLLGILTFIPNYFVMTASGYWMFKFRYLGPRPPNYNPQDGGPPKERNVLQASFFSSYFIVFQLAFIIFVVLTAVFSKKLPPPEKRISAALLCTLVFYVVNLIFVNLQTDSFQIMFFLLVMCIACFVGVCGAVIIVSLFEMVSKFPMEYYSAILTGQALCGVISAMIQILTISVESRPSTAGLIFFGIGTAMVCSTIGIYWYSKRNSQYFIYHVGNENEIGTTPKKTDHCSIFMFHSLSKLKIIFNDTKYYMTSSILVSGATATVYPGLLSLVVASSSNGQTGNIWVDLYFVPVITFVLANICDICGRLLANWIKKPQHELVILAMAIIRMGFIPVMMFCNVQPRNHLPVIFYDVPYVVFTMVFLFSNGYLINICVLLVSTRVATEEDKSRITVMTVLFAVFSTAICSFLSLMLVHLI